MSGYTSHKWSGYNKCQSGKDRWRIVDYRCNYSAFNGYHKTPSDYSRIRCLDCGHHWRTNASYVDELKMDSDRKIPI